MQKNLSNTFVALFVAVMLLCGVVVTSSLFHQAATLEEISQLSANLEAVQARLRKQQVEYAQVQEDLPRVLSELESLQPEADAAYALEQEMRDQRKALRAENAALAEELAALEAQVEAGAADADLTLQALTHLADALEKLKALSGLYE